MGLTKTIEFGSVARNVPGSRKSNVQDTLARNQASRDFDIVGVDVPLY